MSASGGSMDGIEKLKHHGIGKHRPHRQSVQLTLDSRVIVQKNSKRVFNGRVVHSAGFQKFQKWALQSFQFQKAELARNYGITFPLKPPYGMHVEFTMKGKLDSDRDGMEATLQDLLQRTGIIEDDKHIVEWSGKKELGGVGFFTRLIINSL